MLRLGVKTGHPRFFNQISNGLDLISMAGEWLTATCNTNMYISYFEGHFLKFHNSTPPSSGSHTKYPRCLFWWRRRSLDGWLSSSAGRRVKAMPFFHRVCSYSFYSGWCRWKLCFNIRHSKNWILYDKVFFSICCKFKFCFLLYFKCRHRCNSCCKI